MPQFKKSTRKHKKYSVITPSGRTVHFGDTRYQHYKDRTGLDDYSHMNHLDKKRRKSYRQRSMGIRDGMGGLTYLNPESANYYSYNYLW